MSPRILRTCGRMVEGVGAARIDHWLVRSAPEADSGARQIAGLGMDCLKIRTIKDSATDMAIARAAARLGLMLVGHAPEPLSPLTAIAAGQRTFEHAFYPYPLANLSTGDRDHLVSALVEAKAALVPSLVAWRPATLSTAELEDTVRRVSEGREMMLPPALREHWANALPAHREERRGSAGWRRAVETAARDIGTLFRIFIVTHRRWPDVSVLR